jgi:dipeptidyl aminopeptidase/acylaminoacyl peptidase
MPINDWRLNGFKVCPLFAVSDVDGRRFLWAWGDLRMKKALITVAVVGALVAGLMAQTGTARRFGLDDFSRVTRVADPQFSPDGKSIAVLISKPVLDQNRYAAAIYRVDIATQKMQLVEPSTRISVSFPRWSPDGQRIAFLATVGAGSEARPQVFVVSSQGGRDKQLTTAPRGVQQFAWSPDGKTIAFATADELEKKPGWERFNDSFEVQMNDSFLANAAQTPTHVWIMPSAGGPSKRLTSGTWTLPVARPPGAPSSMITWTPDGTAVVFNRTGGARGTGADTGRGVGQQPPGAGRGAGGGGGVQAVKISDGTITPLNANGNFPVYSLQGDQLLTLAGGSVSVTPVAGGQAKSLGQAIDRGLARALWMPDGKSIIVGGNDTTQVSLWQLPIEGAAMKLDLAGVSPSSSYFVDMAVSRTGAIAFAGSMPMHPAELYYMASPDVRPKALTKVNDEIAAIPLGKTEAIEWTNDKFNENGLLTYPPDFNPSQKYPLVLVIHGGPRAASLMSFSAQAHLMAAKGWLVFQPNYRGSDNLGRAYQGAISNDAGEGPGRDVMAGIEAVKAKVQVDESRIAVSGWSYGGYMTTWMIGHYSIWKCAVAGAAVTDQLDQQTFSDGAGGRGQNSPWLNPQAMERVRAQSPITYAANMKTPTLILSNVGDYRVTITQSYKLFHALRDAGVETRFFAYPIYGHNAQDPVRQRDVQTRWIGWIEDHFKTNTNGVGK